MYNSWNSSRCTDVARSSSTWQAAQSQPDIGTGVSLQRRQRVIW